MNEVDFPYQLAESGRTATTGRDDYIRDLIEQVLFTTPGERANRPTFGCGLVQLGFAPNSVELAATTQFLVQGALQQWLGDLIQVERVEVESEDSTLRVRVSYLVRRTQSREVAEFSTGGAAS
jgi:Bacteriophage baseplate protein W